MKRLEVIGHIDVPPAVVNHRFVVEAMANTVLQDSKKRDDPLRNAGVVGTDNSRIPELYGWAANVDPHVDNTGIVYLVGLNDQLSHLYAWAGAAKVKPGQIGKRRIGAAAQLHEARFVAGTVVRLDDFAEHWTEDRGPRVAAFVGSFPTPCDEHALELLRRAIDSLARGDYYGAPRVRNSFRVLRPDEAYVEAGDGMDSEVVLIADARRERRWIQTCSKCDKPAVRLDDYWPYHQDLNLCVEHVRQDDE
jgi:hypothetical protein